MTPLLTLRIAWRALLRNKLRTFLTMLGIIIGVAAVIAMLSIGNGAKIAVEERISSMGTNTVHVFPGSSRRGGSSGGRGTGVQLTVEDWKAVASLPTVYETCPMVLGKAQVVYGSANWSTSVTGTSPSFASVRSWELESGRMFTEGEVRSAANVCVLGREVANQLFGSSDPLEEQIRVGHLPFRVVGVMTEKGESGWGSSKDDTLIIPYTTAMRKLQGTDKLSYITATAERKSQVKILEEQIVNLLNDRYRIQDPKEGGFRAYNQAEVSEVAGESTRVFSLLLGGIASVSLLVGGIGIMNIMLVSVTERIREIGIRMAVGARGIDILMQFLVEAVVLSVIGGAIGVLLGVGISMVVAHYAKWPAVVSQSSILLSFGFAAFIGIFFGFYPALQASRLDPIQALRHE